jgi:hypothetical protein
MGSGFSIFVSSTCILIEILILVYIYIHNRSDALSSGYSKCPVTFRERIKIDKLVQNIELGDIMNISIINEQNLFPPTKMTSEVAQKSPRSDNDSSTYRFIFFNFKCIYELIASSPKRIFFSILK